MTREFIGTAEVVPAKRPGLAQSAPGRWVVTILRWHPTPLNQLLNVHHMRAHRLKIADQAVVAAEISNAVVPHAAYKRRVSLRVILRGKQRAADPDAYWKSLLDALVACNRLKDDSRQWCEIMPVEFERSSTWGSVVTLEDME